MKEVQLFVCSLGRIVVLGLCLIAIGLPVHFCIDGILGARINSMFRASNFTIFLWSRISSGDISFGTNHPTNDPHNNNNTEDTNNKEHSK